MNVDNNHMLHESIVEDEGNHPGSSIEDVLSHRIDVVRDELVARQDALDQRIAEFNKLSSVPIQSKSWWSLDVRGSLALAIVLLMIISIGMLVMLSLLNVKVDPTIFAVLTTLLGVLAGSFKDVYGYFYGSSSGSTSKDEAISKMATASAAIATTTAAATDGTQK